MNSFTNGIGNAVDAIDRMCTNIMLVLIAIAFVMMIIALRTSKTWLRNLFRVLCVIFALVTIFCFQHEVKLYKTGGTLLGISVIGFAATFFVKKQDKT
jgi:succinate-acetate transporter protein